MRSRILFSHKLLLFWLITFSLLFCYVSFTVAGKVSTGKVRIVGTDIYANISEGAHYQHDGKRKVSNNVEVTDEGVSRRVVLEEKWKSPLGKPPDITIFTFKATAYGQGRILLVINQEKGGGTSPQDVGDYLGLADPTALDENDAEHFFVKQRVPHENIREYESGFDSPYDDDCVPVKHKGYDLEVVSGQEDLDADGTAYTEKISIAYGTEKSAQKSLGLTAGWDSAAIQAGYVRGTKSSWGWNIVDDDKNFSSDSMDSTFSVSVDDIVSIQNGPPQDPPCEVCENCNDFVHNENDHYLGVCPLDPSVAGCGKKRWSCENSKQQAWHQIRTCEIGSKFTDPIWPAKCRIQFRHCNNSSCIKRWIPGRGHTDGSTSEAPAGVMNAYADSHIWETQPDDEEDDGGGELVSNPTSPGLYPVNASNITINGEEMVDTAPGDTVTVDLVMPSDKGYSLIYWYLADSSDSGLGNSIGEPTTPSGNGIETEVTHTFSMSSNASGVYTFTAYIYPHSSASDQTVYTYSFKIYCS